MTSLTNLAGACYWRAWGSRPWRDVAADSATALLREEYESTRTRSLVEAPARDRSE